MARKCICVDVKDQNDTICSQKESYNCNECSCPCQEYYEGAPGMEYDSNMGRAALLGIPWVTLTVSTGILLCY